MKMRLQFFGSRGAGGGSGDGTNLGGGSGKPVDIRNQTDVWSFRHNKNNEQFVDQINGSIRTMQNDFPDIMKDVNAVNAVEFGGKDKTNTLGVYSPDGKSVGLNSYYTDIGRMNAGYDVAVLCGYHPSRGNHSGVEAVTFHEMGHAISDHIGKKMGAKNIDDACKKIVNEANRSLRFNGTKALARSISGYATENYAECVAEAFADHYCNGANASKASKAIIKVCKKYV